jgi:hypothetical protein
LEGIGSAVATAADNARTEVEQDGSHFSGLLAALAHNGAGPTDGLSTDGLESRDGVMWLLAAQTEKLDQVSDEARESGHRPGSEGAEKDNARIAVHKAAVAATEKALADTPAEESLKTNLAVLTQPKILVPATLLVLTGGFALLIGLGVIHGQGPCGPLTEKLTEKSACSNYAAFGVHAANVLMSLAAATVGALVGIFAARPGEDEKATTPARAS